MRADNSPQFNRTPVFIALGLALLLVLGVLVGARWMAGTSDRGPVQMAELPGGNADHPACAPLLEELPDEAGWFERAELAEPAPAGSAAWTAGESDELTLRCGVELPFQYHELSETVEINGTEWLRVVDPSTGDALQTWYAVNRDPAVAVTLYQVDPAAGGEDTAPVEDISEAVSDLPEAQNEPNPAPLSGMQPVDDAAQRCGELMDNLPETFGSDPEYTSASVADTQLPGDTSAAWTAAGTEPVVMRCGVTPPENYEPGAVLNQVNDIPWFEDTTLTNGTTSSTWFALGRDTDIAVTVPQQSGNAAVVAIGEAIAEHTGQQ